MTTRTDVLVALGADDRQTAELLAYNANIFDRTAYASLEFPLEPEPHLAAWKRYLDDASRRGIVAELTDRLVQLRFPIREGLSQDDSYRAATLRGLPVREIAQATGLPLSRPELIELWIHPTLAGEIPVLIAGDRQDFMSLVRALSMRNEPKAVPDSMGATMVAGLNNWDRIATLRRAWETEHPEASSEEWDEAFRTAVIPHRELYQDRFILLSRGPYSGVSGAAIGLSQDAWLDLSLVIRLEHECTHYFTRRVFGSMRNNLLDELVADYMGITAAAGSYRADWFLAMVGLENYPSYREGGRLQNYRGDPPLSEGAFGILQALVVAAARNVESFDTQLSCRDAASRAAVLLTLTGFTLEELAAADAPARLAEALAAQTPLEILQ